LPGAGVISTDAAAGEPLNRSPLVSVVLATYNGARFLEEAVRSVLDQTFTDLELIVVDDGSTDRTAELVERLSADPRLRYVYQVNGGQPNADNHGIRLSRGRFIAFIDADDVWLREKLERQLARFDADERIGVVYCPTICIDENGREVESWSIQRHSGRVTDRLFVENFVPFSSSIVRRACFERLGGFDEELAQAYDYDLWLRLSTAYEFADCPEPMVRYRVWPGQMSKNFRVRFDCAVRIMQRFERAHRQALSIDAIREGWAHTHVARGYSIKWCERATWQAIREYARALKFDPLYLDAWRGIVMAVVRR